MLKRYIEIVKIAKQNFSDWFVLIIYPLFSKTEVIKKEEKIIAFASHSFGRLHFFAVDKKHQSQGIGKKLFERIKPKIKSLKIVPENKIAYNLYSKYGFKAIKKSRSYLGAKRILMMIDN